MSFLKKFFKTKVKDVAVNDNPAPPKSNQIIPPDRNAIERQMVAEIIASMGGVSLKADNTVLEAKEKPVEMTVSSAPPATAVFVGNTLDLMKKDIAEQADKDIEEKAVIVPPQNCLDSPEVETVPVLEDPTTWKDLIVFENVNKFFGSKLVLKDISFTVKDIPGKGELIAIVGQSGCGKSTLLRMIAGLKPHFPQTSGGIFLYGNQIFGPGSNRGVIDQKYSLLPNRTVVDNIAFGLELQGMKKKERIDHAREWAKRVHLEGNENLYPHELSGGMQQRVAIAATLILKPNVILMDEPFGALDSKTRLSMQQLLVNLWNEEESTIFIITHQIDEAVYLGDRVFRMGVKPGRLVEILSVPRPDFSPEEARKLPWFTQTVQELLKRLETEAEPSGELPCPKNRLECLGV